MAFKPPRWFGRELPGSGFEKFFGVSSTAIPIAVVGQALEGTLDGTVVLEITDIPDVGEWGAGGTAGIIQWFAPGEPAWATLTNPAATGTVVLDIDQEFWGTEITLSVRALSAEGIAGRVTHFTVLVVGGVQGFANVFNDADDVFNDADDVWAFTNEEV